jgi:tetratricopeptide (TPR) repeat protein
MSASIVSMVTCQERFATINLPRELRDRIYRELLVPERTRKRRDHSSEYNVEPNILRVSKQTHAEAASILYRENTWILLEIHSTVLCDKCWLQIRSWIYLSHIEGYPEKPALKVVIDSPTYDDDSLPAYGDPDNKILVARFDLERFFSRVECLAPKFPSERGNIMDFDLQFSARNRKEEESLIGFFHTIRGAGRVSVEGIMDLSTGRELGTLMMTPIVHFDEVYDWATIYQARGDTYFACRKYEEAIDTYQHGFEYGKKLKYLRWENWLLKGLMGGTSTNAQALAYKYLSMWFACALCNLKLGRDVLDEIYDDHNYVPGRLLAITDDSLHEAHNLLTGGKAEEGLAKVVSTLRTWPLRERVDTEIDYMEVQLRRIVPKTQSGSQ